MRKISKKEPGILENETKNYKEDILNDPKIFKPDSFKTYKLDDKNMAVYGTRASDNKKILHKIMSRKK